MASYRELTQWLLDLPRKPGEKVCGSKPDVFVVGDFEEGFDVAVRIDGGYLDWATASEVAERRQEMLSRLNALELGDHCG